MSNNQKQYFDIGKIKQRQGVSKKTGEPFTIRTLNIHANEKTISSLKKLVYDLEQLVKNDQLQDVQKNIELNLLAPGSERYPATSYEKDGITYSTLNRVAYVIENKN